SLEADIATYVRELMKAQHLEMVLLLREGRFDGVIAGREVGGVSLLTDLPKPDILKRINKKKKDSETSLADQAAPRSSARLAQKPLYRLSVTRSLYGGPDGYSPTSEVTTIGGEGFVALRGERFCFRRE